jgi:hypothetical protein
MYTKEQRELLYEMVPAPERDAIVIFAIENRRVFEVFKAFLNDGIEGSQGSTESTTNVRFANLVGGTDQAKVLLEIASENGLTACTLSENSIVFRLPQGHAYLFVNLFP